MTGEKIRSLRKDHKPGKDEDLLEPDEEAATGTFTSSSSGSNNSSSSSSRTHSSSSSKGKSNKIFSNHKIIKSASQHSNTQPQTHGNANTNTNGLSSPETVDDKNKNPIIRSADAFPVHECVFKGDVRRLSSLIRTQNIAQKDVHGNTPLHLAVMMGHKECAHLLLAHNAPVKVKNAQGWSPLAEAISYGDRQMRSALAWSGVVCKHSVCFD